MDSYKDPRESNKKALLVPLVTLMLCMVALTGCAFAYNMSQSTVDIENTPVDSEFYSIDYTDSDKTSITTPIVGDGADFRVYTDKDVGGDFTAYTDGNTFTREFFVTVKTDMTGTFTLTTTCTVDAKLAGIITVSPIADIVADGNTATKITVNYTVAQGVDLSTVVDTPIVNAESLPAVISEIESCTMDFTVTAVPN